jgi:hypothetical protein
MDESPSRFYILYKSHKSNRLELAKAMQYTASAAQITGIDFDHLAAYIGTISSVTRLSAESIGQSIIFFDNRAFVA